MIDQEEIHKQCLNEDPKECIKGLKQLKDDFLLLSNKEQAWEDLYRLTYGQNREIRREASSALASTFSNMPNKQQVWNDLIELINDDEWFVRSSAAFALGSAVFDVPNKQQVWNDLIKLITHGDSYAKSWATSALGSAFPQVPDKKQAWTDLIKLTTDKESYVKSKVASIIGSVFFYLPDKQQALNELNKLTNDEANSVRAYANHSLGRIHVFKASQAENEEDYRKELEKAIEFYENSARESKSLTHSQFCLPFYCSFHSIIFKKQEAKDEVDKYLAEAKDAIKGSESKKILFEIVENLANALREVQNLENMDLSEMRQKLSSYRTYFDSAAALMRETEETAPYATAAVRKGLPILDRNLKELLEKIQMKAEIACRESHGTPTQEIACTVNKEVEKWEMGSQEEMTQKVEDIAYILKTKVANLPENEYVLSKIEAMRNERNLTQQYETLLFVIGLIPTMKVVPKQELELQLEQQLNPIHYKLDSISYNTNLIFNEIINIKDKLSYIRFDIFKMKWNSAEIVSNLKTMKEELEKLNKIEGLNTLSIEKLNSSQKQTLTELNDNILESLDEIGILADKLPNKEDTQKILESINKLKQSKQEVLFQKSMDIISLIEFAMKVFPYILM